RDARNAGRANGRRRVKSCSEYFEEYLGRASAAAAEAARAGASGDLVMQRFDSAPRGGRGGARLERLGGGGGWLARRGGAARRAEDRADQEGPQGDERDPP